MTLRLFDTLLQKEEEHIFHNLVLRNLLGRNYITSVSPEVQKSSGIQIASLDGQVPILMDQRADSNVNSLASSALEVSSDVSYPSSPDSIGSVGEYVACWLVLEYR